MSSNLLVILVGTDSPNKTARLKFVKARAHIHSGRDITLRVGEIKEFKTKGFSIRLREIGSKQATFVLKDGILEKEETAGEKSALFGTHFGQQGLVVKTISATEVTLGLSY